MPKEEIKNRPDLCLRYPKSMYKARLRDFQSMETFNIVIGKSKPLQADIFDSGQVSVVQLRLPEPSIPTSDCTTSVLCNACKRPPLPAPQRPLHSARPHEISGVK